MLEIDARVQLGDIIKAAVHERMMALTAESEQARIARLEAASVRESAWEATNQEMLINPPKSLAALIAGFDSVDVYVQVEWDYVMPSGDLPTIVRLTGSPPRDRKNGLGFHRQFEIGITLGPVSDTIREMLIDCNVKAQEATEAERRENKINAMLNDRGLRERMEAELISRVVRQQLPEVGAMIDDMAKSTDRRLTG